MLRKLTIFAIAFTVLLDIGVRAYVSSGRVPTVKTKLGTVIGKYQYFQSEPVATFLGIPYAHPPVGPLRFWKPILIRNWTKPIRALKNPPACVDSSSYQAEWVDSHSRKSEDCLYLNIWVPQHLNSCRQLKTVMFWIYGGAFFSGSNGLDVFNGKVLATLGDVVVVTFNYRLGPFGFLYAATRNAPGNAALFDVVEALKWVSENIEAFGGDKNQITVFGWSAGAIFSSMLAISPVTRHLFKRMILESTSPVERASSDSRFSNYNKTLVLAANLGCLSKNHPTHMERLSMVECLKRIDANTLAATESNSQLLFEPQYGDELLHIDYQDSIRAGDIKDCEVLTGVTKDELSIFIALKFPEYSGEDYKLTKVESKQIITKLFPNLEDSEAIFNYYYGDVPDDDYNLIRKKTADICSDMKTRCPTEYIAESLAKNSKVFFYTFEHRSSRSPHAEWIGVPHFDEVPYVFGKPLREFQNSTLDDQRISRELIKIWISFAKTGKPIVPSDNWPLYSRQSPKYVVLNSTTEFKIGYGPLRENCDFLRNIFGYM